MGFELGRYDRRFPLVIDPVLAFSTYLGGPYEDQPGGIAVGPDGSVTIAGWDGLDAVLTRIDAAGALVWSARLGGSDFEAGQDVAVDGQGNVYVTGSTFSADFPVVGGVQGVRKGPGDAFVAKLAPDGRSLLFSTFLGGSGIERGNGIGVDATGAVTVAGFTLSADFPVTPGAPQMMLGGGADAFVAKLSPSGSALIYATYLGGAENDGYSFDQSNVLAVDAAGNAWVTGPTRSLDFPTTASALRRSYAGGDFDAFVARFSPDGSLSWSTYLGGGGYDSAYGIAAAPDGSVFIAGVTLSPDFPVTPGAFDTVPAPCCFSDGFLARLDSSGSRLLLGTFLGGSQGVGAYDVALSSGGYLYITGKTNSTDLPLVDPVQSSCSSCGSSGYADAFAMVLDPSGSRAVFSTYLGGLDEDRGNAVAVDAPGSLWVAGEAGRGFPVTPGALQTLYGGGTSDGFLVKVAFATTQFILDVNGYFTSDGSFFTLTPCRVVDTRRSPGPGRGPALIAGGDRTFRVTGNCGVPTGALALAANLAVTAPTSQGHLRLFPSGSPSPLVSSLNYSAGQTRSNNAIVPLGPDGSVIVRCVQLPPP